MIGKGPFVAGRYTSSDSGTPSAFENGTPSRHSNLAGHTCGRLGCRLRHRAIETRERDRDLHDRHQRQQRCDGGKHEGQASHWTPGGVAGGDQHKKNAGRKEHGRDFRRSDCEGIEKIVWCGNDDPHRQEEQRRRRGEDNPECNPEHAGIMAYGQRSARARPPGHVWRPGRQAVRPTSQPRLRG